jgi:ABC-type multidrug transport system fused ATPase/permease subunit
LDTQIKQYRNLLAKHVGPQKARFILLAVLLLGSIALQLVSPQIVRAFVDQVTSSREGQALLGVALAYLGATLLQMIVTVGATYVGEDVAWATTNTLRDELADHCLRLDMRFHNEHRPGELIERIDGDVTRLASLFSQLVIELLGSFMLLLGTLVALILEDWRMGTVFCVLAALTLFVLIRTRNLAVPHHKAARQAEADLFGYIEEQLVATEDIRPNGAVDFVLRGLYRLQYQIMRSHFRAGLIGRAIRVLAEGTLALGHIVAVVVGYYFYQSGALSVGAVYLIVQYIVMLSRPIRGLTRQVGSLQSVSASVERLTELLEVQTIVPDGPGQQILQGPLSLAFDRVCFSYTQETAKEEPVLDGLSFHLAPGTVLGLLGRTGSGKTTLARLVFRLYDPTAGHILLGGIDIRTPQVGELRQRVALVTQDVQLFQASVRDNLTFFDDTVPDERILTAMKELELGDWLDALPQGLDTVLGAGGRSLSAGEAQLLAFVRTFLRDPGLVILDEASSRLDPVTEQRIERAVERLLRSRTAIVIAHRLGTIQRADEIMILEGGRISEHGNRAQLASDPSSRFYRLLQTGLEEVLG